MKTVRSLIFALLAFNLSAACAQPRPQANTLLVVGDSLSAAYMIPIDQGWVALLAKKVKQDIKVINLSRSGDTTLEGLNKLPGALSEYQPKWIILELGGNDGLRGLPLHVIEKNLSAMLTLIQNAGTKVLLVGVTLPPNYGERYIQGLEGIYLKLAKEFKTPLIPFLLEKIATHPELMQQDGIHPTAQAQFLVLETVCEKMNKEAFLNH